MKRLVLIAFLGCTSVPSQYAAIPLYASGSAIKPPKIMRQVEPTPPAGIGGTVVIESVIDETGSVVDSWVVSGSPALGKYVIDAVKRSRFSPAMLDGKLIAVRIRETVTIKTQTPPSVFR